VLQEQAEVATKAKANFLSNMSHEVRTPLNAVLGIARLLADTTLSLEQQQYVSMIVTSGHLLLTILDDILDYSKIEAGQLRIQYGPHNLVDIVEQATFLCYEMAVSKGLYLSWQVDPTLPPILMLDTARLQQVLLNLLSNAIKFTKTGGVQLIVTGQPLSPAAELALRHVNTSPRNGIGSGALTSRSRTSPALSAVASPGPISSSPGRATPSESVRHYQLEFEIRDTGIGITPAQVSMLFKSFSQVQHINGEYGGTGLGLVICKRLVSAMGGGDLRVRSQQGGAKSGSSFSFHIVSAQFDGSQVSTPVSTSTRLSSSSLTAGGTRRLVPVSRPLPVHNELKQQQQQQQRNGGNQTQQLFRLSAEEMGRLAHSSVVYVGVSNPASQVWVALLKHYGATVISCSTIAEVVQFLHETSHNTAVAHHTVTASPPLLTPSAIAHLSPTSAAEFPMLAAFRGVCHALVMDLDSCTAGLSEESLVEAVISYAPLRMLCLYSKAHMELPSDALLHALGENTTPTGSPLSPDIVNRERVMVPALLVAEMEQSFAMPLDVASSTTGGGGAAAAAAVATAATAAAGLPPFTPVVSFTAPRPSWVEPDVVSPPQQPQPHHERAPSSSAGMARILRRVLRKPFKLQSFLDALLAVFVDPVPVLTVPLTPSCAAAAAAAVVSSSTTQGPTTAATMNATATAMNAAAAAAATVANSSSGSALRLPLRNKIASISATYPLRILLAEDNLINQKMMVMLLRRLGYEICIADNGLAALQLIEEKAARGPEFEIQCIIMDASMDVMDGMECTRVIRSQQQPHRVRPFIIAHTANVTQEFKQNCLEAGMDQFTTKPVHVDQLIRCLKLAYAAQRPSASPPSGISSAPPSSS
jgi:signal transduction histidine kinase/CheY-like chemotaxis protein